MTTFSSKLLSTLLSTMDKEVEDEIKKRIYCDCKQKESMLINDTITHKLMLKEHELKLQLREQAIAKREHTVQELKANINSLENNFNALNSKNKLYYVLTENMDGGTPAAICYHILANSEESAERYIRHKYCYDSYCIRKVELVIPTKLSEKDENNKYDTDDE